jgi:hypothetical protein
VAGGRARGPSVRRNGLQPRIVFGPQSESGPDKGVEQLKRPLLVDRPAKDVPAEAKWVPVVLFHLPEGSGARKAIHRMLWRELIEELTLIAVAAAAGAGMFLVITFLIPPF